MLVVPHSLPGVSLNVYFSWGSSLGKELKYISISTTAYILVRMVCAQVIYVDLPGHAHVLPGVTWGHTCVAVHMCVLLIAFCSANEVWLCIRALRTIGTC